MHYAELPVPSKLRSSVAAIWTMDAGGNAGDPWVEQHATPDGCIELIHRLRGRSIWLGEQPAMFATGLNRVPVTFAMSGDARFTGVRLWPWAWSMLSGIPCSTFAGRWTAIDPNGTIGSILSDPNQVATRLADRLADGHPLALHIFNATSLADIVEASGWTHRTVQRWFEKHVGMPPRQYLRLIRFRRSMVDLAGPAPSFADRAVSAGFADQAHMARDFRRLAGVRPTTAKATAQGPFLPGRGQS